MTVNEWSPSKRLFWVALVSALVFFWAGIGWWIFG